MNNKQYKAMEFFIGKEDWEISKAGSNFSIAGRYEGVKFFQHPRLFIRKNDGKGVLRLNFCTYFPVAIPDKFKGELAKCGHVEIIFSSDADVVEENRFVPVSNILKFPELYELNLRPEEPAREELGNLGELLENSSLDQVTEDESKEEWQESEEEVPEESEYLSCRQTLEQWLTAHKDFSMQMKQCGDSHFCMITDNRSKLFLICLFEEEGCWLADEDVYNESVPLYFSEKKHVVSPVFAAAAIADFWRCRTGVEVHHLVLFDEAVSIINEEMMEDVWRKSSANLCCCNRNYGNMIVKNFDECMHEVLESGSGVLTKEQIAVVSDEFSSLDEQSYQEAAYNGLRTFQLDQVLPEDYTTGDIIKTWLRGNYCKSILLARYWDKEFRAFFSLVYNFSNIALILENNPAVKDPVACVKAIREKLLKSGISSPLTPCILSGGNGCEYDSNDVKCYDYKALFQLEKNLFAREMEFEKYPDISLSDVRTLICFGDTNFHKEVAVASEKYDPEYEDLMLEELGRIEDFWDDKRLFVHYENNLFEHSAWTIVRQKEYSKTVIILKSFSGDDIENKKFDIAEEHKRNCADHSQRTAIKTVVLVPERMVKKSEDYCMITEDVFYVGIAKFKKLICKILIDD